MLYAGLKKAGETKGWKLEGASMLGAALTYTPITLTGEEGGVPIQLFRASAFHTFATNAFFKPAIAVPFEIASEGMTGAIRDGLGIEDVQIGDEEFDREFRLVSKAPSMLKRLLTAEVRAVLKELMAEARPFGSHFRVTEQVVSLWHASWGLMTEEEVLRDLPLCVRAVKTIQAAAKEGDLAGESWRSK